jgi:hypothetical protein
MDDCDGGIRSPGVVKRGVAAAQTGGRGRDGGSWGRQRDGWLSR